MYSKRVTIAGDTRVACPFYWRAGQASGRDFRTNGEHRVLNITGKGNKERTTPLHMEGAEKLAAWLALPGIGDDPAAYLFRPQK